MIMLPIKAFDTVQPLFGLTAFGLLIYFVVAGRFDVVGPVLVILAVKLAVDVLFHLWVLGRYRRWSVIRIGPALRPPRPRWWSNR